MNAAQAAAVTPAAAPAVKKGQIVFMKNWKAVDSAARVPASADTGSAHKYFKTKVATANKWSLTTAPIRFYGLEQPAPAMVAAPVAPRLPASVMPQNVVAMPKKVGTDLNIDSDFSNSLRQEQATQPKHSKELENLIQDLKSYWYLT